LRVLRALISILDPPLSTGTLTTPCDILLNELSAYNMLMLPSRRAYTPGAATLLRSSLGWMAQRFIIGGSHRLG
jgi:hypothetical protein